MYSFVKGLLWFLMKMFFREVEVVGLERVPLSGPVIFVGNHSNQFVDAMMLVVNIPRQICFLIAAKSMNRVVIGDLARAMGCVAVSRPQDMAAKGKGKVTWEKGSRSIQGKAGGDFNSQIKPGDKIACEGVEGAMTVLEVKSATELLLKDPPAKGCPEGGASFKVLPKVDQAEVYDAVTDHLCDGGAIGIFPEGGSHDQTKLLPLKPGVAIMAFNAMLEGAEGVTIVPIGLNYFQAHRFRSQAMIEIGMPFEIPPELPERYQQAEGKEKFGPVNEFLAHVEKRMNEVIVTAANFQEQQMIRLCVTLYPPERMRLRPNLVFQLAQKFAKLFSLYKSTAELLVLGDRLEAYRDRLRTYRIDDHQVWRLQLSFPAAVWKLGSNFWSLVFSLALGLPMLPLWGPIWLVCLWAAERHRLKALRESKVKVKATDVMASYKIIVAVVLVPLVNILYGSVVGVFFFDDWYERLLCVAAAVCFLPTLYYLSLRRIEAVIPLLRSIRIGFGAILRHINEWRQEERDIAHMRNEMQLLLRKVVKDLGSRAESGEGFMEELYALIPRMVIEQDSRRLEGKREFSNITPARLGARMVMSERQEEIL
uniref:Phospholipid/glycerol acyltransferase domain-containing protein n=1 Tax=Chromera velia CCMP2878 TaxID=1169474 RepID=A0A0G4G3P1_9ALVE|mmetsp:Transcript_46589/g.91998  ORF Transcript_46589/g.91998 Transcript_46589/m.91998 type:complete len:593 (+) Transcript_46589:309-2087(+)|eukprot:Cvel_20129.t1-p1 / transcript=Cvel_20129.t1 / gene=Cvel_20129 / organism=Chromera_velia_CCMP2878 / gene_product=Uncharacterized acyltransferase C1718.04, putative / transcript_product=Uncharacterized acyltransferase C1718.04, putative / location=Cvel_scaffold1785:461-16353(+) / protein_length=592 / sequence_SO=supercontig / SO=protein_coding / is_pseudo=false